MAVLILPFEKVPFTSFCPPGRHPLVETALRSAVDSARSAAARRSLVSWYLQNKPGLREDRPAAGRRAWIGSGWKAWNSRRGRAGGAASGD